MMRRRQVQVQQQPLLTAPQPLPPFSRSPTTQRHHILLNMVPVLAMLEHLVMVVMATPHTLHSMEAMGLHLHSQNLPPEIRRRPHPMETQDPPTVEQMINQPVEPKRVIQALKRRLPTVVVGVRRSSQVRQVLLPPGDSADMDHRNLPLPPHLKDDSVARTALTAPATPAGLGEEMTATVLSADILPNLAPQQWDLVPEILLEKRLPRIQCLLREKYLENCNIQVADPDMQLSRKERLG